MKKFVLLFILSLGFMTSAHATDLELTYPNILNSLEVFEGKQEFSGGKHQGVASYAAQLECSNEQGSEDITSMKCYVRSLVGFSVIQDKPVKLTDNSFSEELREMMSNEEEFSFLVKNGFQVLSGILSCEIPEGTGDPNHKPSCYLSSQNF